jgi:hypothetical protein
VAGLVFRGPDAHVSRVSLSRVGDGDGLKVGGRRPATGVPTSCIRRVAAPQRLQQEDLGHHVWLVVAAAEKRRDAASRLLLDERTKLRFERLHDRFTVGPGRPRSPVVPQRALGGGESVAQQHEQRVSPRPLDLDLRGTATNPLPQ